MSDWTLGLSQKSRTVLGRWDGPKDPDSQHHGVYFLISETQPGTVPEARDSPKCQESQHHGDLNLRDPKTWDSPRPLGLSQKPESRHHGVLFLVKLF